jgi:hypothetical protein
MEEKERWVAPEAVLAPATIGDLGGMYDGRLQMA